MTVSSKFEREFTSQGLERTALLQLSFQEHSSKEHYIFFAGTAAGLLFHAFLQPVVDLHDGQFFFSLSLKKSVILEEFQPELPLF